MADLPPLVKPTLRNMPWWPLLLAPAGIVIAAVVASTTGIDHGEAERFLDDRAPALLVGAILVYALRLGITRNPLYLVMLAFCIALFCRENRDYWPFNWHDIARRGIYFALGAIFAWGCFWRRRLDAALRDYRHTGWIVATVSAYVISFLIYKRVFKFIPGEQPLHNYFEECTETVAHLMLIVTASLGSLERYAKAAAAAPAEANENAKAAA